MESEMGERGTDRNQERLLVSLSLIFIFLSDFPLNLRRAKDPCNLPHGIKVKREREREREKRREGQKSRKNEERSEDGLS